MWEALQGWSGAQGTRTAPPASPALADLSTAPLSRPRRPGTLALTATLPARPRPPTWEAEAGPKRRIGWAVHLGPASAPPPGTGLWTRWLCWPVRRAQPPCPSHAHSES